MVGEEGVSAQLLPQHQPEVNYSPLFENGEFPSKVHLRSVLSGGIYHAQSGVNSPLLEAGGSVHPVDAPREEPLGSLVSRRHLH